MHIAEACITDLRSARAALRLLLWQNTGRRCITVSRPLFDKIRQEIITLEEQHQETYTVWHSHSQITMIVDGQAQGIVAVGLTGYSGTCIL